LLVVATALAGLGGFAATPLHGSAAGTPAWATSGQRLSAAAERIVALRTGKIRATSGSNSGHACKAETSSTGNVQVNCLAEDGSAPNNTQSETSVAAFGQQVVVGYNDSLVCCNALNFSGYSVSLDGGKTFKDMGDVPWRPHVQPIGDPSVSVDGHGNFYYASLALTGLGLHDHSLVAVYKMNAGTSTFHLLSVPVDAGDQSMFFADKEYMAVGADSHGHLHFYLSWTFFTTVVFSPIELTRSTDGAHWSTTEIADHLTCDQGSNPVPAGDIVYVSWVQSQPQACEPANPNPAGQEMMATVVGSTGQRVNLNTITLINGSGDAIIACNSSQDLREVIQTAPGRDARTFELPSTTVDRNGVLYAVWQDRPAGLGGPTSNATAIWLAFSLDNNQTWSPPQLISGANAKHFYADRWQPWITADATGLHAMWYQEVAGGQVQADKEDLTLATPSQPPSSTAGEQKISSATFPVVQTDPNQDPVISNCYMGDYNNIASAGGVRYVTWGDNRNVEFAARIGREHQPDVFLQSY
jgi:hypothetical protein